MRETAAQPNPMGHLGKCHEDLFAFNPESVRSVRKFVASTLTGWGCTDRLDEALICVSELSTNAVLYAAPLRAGGFLVRLDLYDGHLRIEVHDGGASPTKDRAATEDGGWGLHLVQGLSDTWGVENHKTGSGKGIWCQFAASGCTA